MKVYIGDAVYARHDGYGVMLTTENGVSVTNTIYLEPEVLAALNGYVAEFTTRLTQPAVEEGS